MTASGQKKRLEAMTSTPTPTDRQRDDQPCGQVKGAGSENVQIEAAHGSGGLLLISSTPLKAEIDRQAPHLGVARVAFAVLDPQHRVVRNAGVVRYLPQVALAAIELDNDAIKEVGLMLHAPILRHKCLVCKGTHA